MFYPTSTRWYKLDSTSSLITLKRRHLVSPVMHLQIWKRHWHDTNQWWPNTLIRTTIEYVTPRQVSTHCLTLSQFFSSYATLILSTNYVTKRQSLKLLGEILLDRANFNVMTRYIANEANLKMMMNLLRDKSKNIQFEAFHVFKVSFRVSARFIIELDMVC